MPLLPPLLLRDFTGHFLHDYLLANIFYSTSLKKNYTSLPPLTVSCCKLYCLFDYVVLHIYEDTDRTDNTDQTDNFSVTILTSAQTAHADHSYINHENL